jgi:hypothetical protein
MNGAKTTFEKAFRGRRTARAACAIFALLIATGVPGFAQHRGPESFSSPEEASRALFAAVKADDDQALMKILGSGKELVSLEDEVQNKHERKEFVDKYQEMHRLVREPDRTVVLYIGAENWPFPVPLVSTNGAWRFDSRTGMREVLYRRIGENETKAIGACHTLAQGEGEQSKLDEGAIDNRITALLKTNSKASGDGQNEPIQSQGYYFRRLTSGKKNAPDAGGDDNAGLAFIAFPVEYRKSGVMTFIVGKDGVVYEKDLGPNTRKLATAMTTYRVDSTWKQAE